jgi:hypothetical protein
MLHNTMLERLANDKHYLIGPNCKLQRKRSVVNAAPGDIFTTLHFDFMNRPIKLECLSLQALPALRNVRL